MGRFFCGYTGETTSTAIRTVIRIIASAEGKSFEMYETGHYGDGHTAAADIQHEIRVGFATNGGVGAGSSSVTPEPMSGGTAPALCTSNVTFTTEPTTYTTNVLTLMSFNQRGGMRWAVPLGMGYTVFGANTNKDLGILVISSAAGTVNGNTFWNE